MPSIPGEEIKFSCFEHRALELPQREKQYGKEASALRKIIDNFPWILHVADHKFDRYIADIYTENAAIVAKANIDANKELHRYLKEKKSKDSP